MMFVKFSNELKCKPSGGGSVCGICLFCVFAPKPAGSPQSLWKVSDKHRRKFLVDLLLRCNSVLLLENIQNMLCTTSWTLFTYARGRVPPRPQDCTAVPAKQEEAPCYDMEELRKWFSKSPDWIKSNYLCRLFLFCDLELLRMFSNLIDVLLTRMKLRSRKSSGHDSEGEDPALTVVPGSSKSMSGVSRYRDYIGTLPVDLSKRILGLLDDHTLKLCQKVCRRWQHIAKETIEETKFRRTFHCHLKTMVKTCRGINDVSPTYANFVEVHVPTRDDEDSDSRCSHAKVKPPEPAYARIKTKIVRMEERNVYCGAYFPKVLLIKEDPHRVVDYRGKSFMVTASKDCALNLYHVASEARAVSVMKGHVGSVRAVLLCEDRNMVITASCDATIRCWNLKTDTCEMVLYGHTGTVNCLDVDAERLVSGAKDCTVRVWDLQSGKQFERVNFKHPGSINCVKMSVPKLYSCCDRGLVKIWNMEKPSLLRVIDAHKSSVKCLFFNEWYLLSGDFNGQVMVWSTDCLAKECLMTFSHPKDVKSLALIYLRVVTGCGDGNIRIFNFLTGDCLRVISAEEKAGRILSLHFLENSILVNTICSVRLFHFAKVFWDYSAESAEDGQERSTDDLRKVTFKDHTQDLFTFDAKKPDILPLEGMERFGPAPVFGLGDPLKVSASLKSWETEGVSTNCSAPLQDPRAAYATRGPFLADGQNPASTSKPPACDGQLRRAKTCLPTLERGAGQNVTGVSNAADASRRGAASRKAQASSADPKKAKGRAAASMTSAKKQTKQT